MGTLGYAILGLLAKEPRTGYQIARAMNRPIGYIWTARHSQIYPELASLEADGLVRHTVVDGRGPRETKRYEITTTGTAVLRRWIDSPLLTHSPRSELMLRVWSLWLLPSDRAKAFIEDIRAEGMERLAQYRIEEQQFIAEGPSKDDREAPNFGAYATLMWGIAREDRLIEWCDWLIERLAHATDNNSSQSESRT